MVLSFQWHQTAVEAKKSNNCLSMTGEDTGLEALASPQAGYLGKVQERAESLEFCPWCTSKGFTFSLRSYHINLQESITLCTNPQCLFPLVTRPLEDVLSSLVPVVPTVGNKRKNTLDLEKEDVIESPFKRPRSSKVGSFELQQQSEHESVNPLINDLHAVPKTQHENVGGNDDCMDTETWDSLQDEDVAPPPGSDSFGHQSDILNGDGVEHQSDVLLNNDGVEHQSDVLLNGDGVEHQSDVLLNNGVEHQSDVLLNNDGVEHQSDVLLKGDGVEHQSDVLLNNDGVEHQSDFLLNNDGVEHQSDVLLNGDGVKHQADVLLNNDGVEHQADVLLSGDGVKHQADVLLNGDGVKHQADVLLNNDGVEHQSDVLLNGDRVEHQSDVLLNGDGVQHQSDVLLNGDGVQHQSDVLLSGDGVEHQSDVLLSGDGVKHQADVLLNSDGVESSLPLHRGVNGSSENSFKEEDVPVSNGCSKPSPSQDISLTNNEFQMILGNKLTPKNKKSLIADISGSGDAEGIRLEREDLASLPLRQSEELISVPEHLLWENSDNLCWLDSLLSALVNCKTLRRLKPKDEPHHSSVWQLLKGYEDICAAVQVHQQTGRDGVVKVPSHVLQKADVELQSLRMSVFKQLQPKLRCILGQMETPVFAMPLLLTMDSWVEHLFQSTFHWEFRCNRCKVVTKERVIKTLPTFTNIVPDWRPLNAVHVASCNMCGKKNQKRTMLLESVPPVFVLHFVEGLPNRDVGVFTFSFQGKRYSITTVIQYSHRLKHFATWIRNDESWLEYDDLKYPDFKTHRKLKIRAREMHLVFWEVEEDADPPACSPLDTFAEQAAVTPSLNTVGVDEPLSQSPDQSLLTLHDDTDIVDALTDKDGTNMTDTTVAAGVDASIGSTTLLDAFEGLSHDDIVTLTLVEVAPANSETQRLNDNQQTQDCAPIRTERPEPSPDSSFPAAGGGVCHNADLQPPATLNSSNSESVDSSSTDVSLAARRGRRRGASQKKPICKQRGKEEVVSEEAPQTSPTSSELPETVSQETDGPAAQDDSSFVEVAQQASPESSTDATPLPSSQKNHPIDQSARWSYLLSKHPLTPPLTIVQKPATIPRTSPGTEVKSSQPVHSTPNPVKRQTTLSGPPKPQLLIMESIGLPPKAAEMYGGFGTKSSANNSPLPSPPPPSNAKPFQTITANQPAPPMVTILKKPSTSKVPPGLSETEALRYKLIKKLKAKKKKLAKLNQLLGNQNQLQPDSTELNSPSTVASSAYNGSGGGDFLSDLLSPATTASNLSPDSTGFLEMLTNGQEGADTASGMFSAAGAGMSQTDCGPDVPGTENFLEDFLMQCCGFDAN